MNTDAILDFFVEYYIWFIVGGAIVAFAIIGFIVDKKHFFGNKKTKKQKINQNNESQNFIKEQENNELEMSENTDEIISQDNQITLDSNYQEENFEYDEPVIVESSNVAYGNDEKIEPNTSEEVNYKDIDVEKEYHNTEYNEIQINKDAKINNESIDNNFNEYNNNLELNFSDNQFNDNYQINFDKNNMTNIDNIDSSYKEYGKQDQNNFNNNKMVMQLNNDDSDNLQISYSQLKEMVEDIIEENQKEKLQKQINENSNDDSVKVVFNKDLQEQNNSIDFSDLDRSAVDNVKQDDDEDDVWKF